MTSVENRGYWPSEWPAWPEGSRARAAVLSSLELGLGFLDAPIFLRKMRLEAADARVQSCLAEMGEREHEQASELVDLWERNALIQQNIRYEKKKRGIDAVDHLLSKWNSAGDEVRRAEDGALELGPAAYEYFQSRVERFHILQEERDEVGQYQIIPDYSELRRQWYSRQPITEPLPWPWDKMLARCKQFENRGPTAWERLAQYRFQFVTVILGIVSILLTVASIVVAMG